MVKYDKTEKYYVYIYLDPLNSFIPFYVGKGYEYRYREHLYEKVNKKNHNQNRKKVHKIQKIIKETGNYPPILFFVKDVDEETAYNIETNLIKHLGRKDIDENGVLTNLCEDGRPPSPTGKRHRPESIEKMKQVQKGKIISNEQREKISATLKAKGIKPPSRKGIKIGTPKESTKLLLSLANKGKTLSEETKIKIREARTKQVFSEETRKKKSEKMKVFWANKRRLRND